MPDQRRHRGPHPEDRRLFAAGRVVWLRAATGDLSWLLTRGYPPAASLKLVGDRYQLEARQRLAVARSACGNQALEGRRSREVDEAELQGRELWIDGYNVLTTIEAALSGGVILVARDGCCRDMASMHGSYRKVRETLPALELLGEWLSGYQPLSCHWLLDQPVSNSGRLKRILETQAVEHGWPWSVQLVANPDEILANCSAIVASADSQILDRAPRWFNLARTLVEARIAEAWIVDLSGA